MSLEKIKAIFEATGTCSAWSLQLLRIKNSKRSGTTYSGREVAFSPEGTLSAFVDEVSQRYISGKKAITNTFVNGITEYDGSTIDKTIYRLPSSSELIATEYDAMINAIATPDTEIDPLEFDAQAYLLKGVITLDGEEKPVKLISMQTPITTLQHKFLRSNGTFKEISDKVISLRTSIDVVIIDDTVYMLTLAGENLFNMERAYKATCSGKLTDIEQCDIVTDFSEFSSIAGSGHNPRKFVSFNDSHLQKLKSADSRRKMAQKFNIPLDGDKFDTSTPGASEKLVKLLCDRGMVDPFDDNPMEVAGSKKWE